MPDVSHVSSAALLLARRELAALPRLLKAGEEVADVCHGTSDGRAAVIVVTDRRLLHLRRRRLLGAAVESIALARVISAEEQAGARHASVIIDTGGRTIRLAQVDHALAQVFCERLRQRLAGRG